MRIMLAAGLWQLRPGSCYNQEGFISRGASTRT